MSPSKVIACIAAACLLVGIVMIGLSIRTPAFIDPEAAAEHLAKYPPDPIQADPAQLAAYTANWRSKMDLLSTDKWPLLDCGAALVTLGLCAGVAAVIASLKGVRSLESLSSPRRRWLLIGLGVAGMWLVLAGSFLSLYLDYERGRILPWQDSGVLLALHGAVPIAGVLTLVLSIVGTLLLLRARLPVGLLRWDGSRSALSVSTLMAFLILLGLVLVFLASAFTSSAGWLALPGLILWMYVLASTRAALLSWR